MTKYPKSECEEHLDVKTDRPVCVICMMDEIEQMRDAATEAAEILDNLMASIKAHGHYSVDSTLTFLGQARQCLQVPNA